MNRVTRSRRCAVAVCVPLLAACSVDDRHLVAAPDSGFSGSALDGGGLADGNADLASRTEAGTARDAHADAPASSEGDAGLFHGCADADGDGIPDCQESLVANATFDLDALGWVPETSIVQAWRPVDAWHEPISGSLAVESTVSFNEGGWTLGGTNQCVVVKPDTSYAFSVETLMAGSQGSGGSALNAWIFDGPGCTGNLSLGFTSEVVSSINQWATIRGEFKTPANATTMLVRLVVTKPFRQQTFEALFDGVRIREQ